MKRFKKGYIVIAAMALSMSLLAGCGESGNAKEGTLDETKTEAKSDSATEEGPEATEDFASIDEMVNTYAAEVVLGEYKGIEYEELSTEVTDEEVQKEIDNFLSQHGSFDKDMESAAKTGDTVNIDFVGTVDGVEFEGGNSNGNGYDLVLGSGSFIDGFEDQIVSHKAGETFVVKVTFPEDYGKEELNGKPAEFKTTLNYIKIDKPAEFTDELVAANSDYKTTKEYTKAVNELLTQQKNDTAVASAQSEIMGNIINTSEIKNVPTATVQKNVNKFIDSINEQAQGYGMEYADFVYYSFGYDDLEKFNSAVYAMCEETIKERMVMCAIAKAEGIAVTDEEAEAFVNEYSAKNNLDAETVKSTYSTLDIKYNALAEKVMNDVLMKNAKAVKTTE